jgi:ubiquinone/menaquinone biosynthesis C-methylase UbiE
MDHQDHVYLLRPAIRYKGGVWADLGSGDGAFTLALRDLAGAEVEILSIDQDPRRLKNQEKNFSNLYPKTNIHFINADFTKLEHLPLLDGVVMANSLHYIKDQLSFLVKLHSKIKDSGQLALVEYNSDQVNPWVPYPIPFEKFKDLVREAGFKEGKFLSSVPSTWLNEIYCAQALK